MSISNKELQEIFFNQYSNLDQETIIKINNNAQGGDINNVVVGLEMHCYGVWAWDDTLKETYQLFYINGEKKLEGSVLELAIKQPYRDKLVFLFAQFLANSYESLDAINVFNTLQNQTRSFFERVGYFTVSNNEIKKFEGQNAEIFAFNTKGVINIQFLEKDIIYKELLGNKKIDSFSIGTDHVYLVMNKKNGFIKIGKSKTPHFREKTLQSDDPDIELISFWIAPSKQEKELHKLFNLKRKRGEWFDLSFKDIKTIGAIMKQYD